MIVSLVNLKGGVGKSTISAHLAGLYFELEQRVALVDCDTQESSSRWVREACPQVQIFSLHDPDEVLEKVPIIGKEFDLVVCDGPAGLSEVSRCLLLVTDLAVVPIGPSSLDVESAQRAVRTINQARAIRTDGKPRALLVPNRIQTQTTLSKELLDLGEKLGIPLSNHSLRLLTAYADAPGQGRLVWNMGARAKDAADDMVNLLKEVMKNGA